MAVGLRRRILVLVMRVRVVVLRVVVVRLGRVIWQVVVRVVVVGKRVRERRQGLGAWAVHVWPVPDVGQRCVEDANDWLAFDGDGRSVGVLSAHHDESLSVDGKSSVKRAVASLEVVDFALEIDKSRSVLGNLVSVPLNLLVVLIDEIVVVLDAVPSIVDAVLQGSDGLTDGFSADEHVTGLGNLELVSVLTEQSSVSVERVHGLAEVRGGRVGWGSSRVSSVVVVNRVVVVVVVIQLWLGGLLVARHWIGAKRGDSKEGSGKGSHRRIKVYFLIRFISKEFK